MRPYTIANIIIDLIEKANLDKEEKAKILSDVSEKLDNIQQFLAFDFANLKWCAKENKNHIKGEIKRFEDSLMTDIEQLQKELEEYENKTRD